MNTKTYIGQLDTRIELIETTLITGTSGEQVSTDTTFNTVWSKMEDVSGTEDEDGKILALNVRKYTVRYDPALVAKKITDMFIDDAGDKYNVHSTEYLGRKEYIILKCSKRE